MELFSAFFDAVIAVYVGLDVELEPAQFILVRNLRYRPGGVGKVILKMIQKHRKNGIVVLLAQSRILGVGLLPKELTDKRGVHIRILNLPLLYWATEVTNDPRFSRIAILHADMAMKYFIRENGSAIHIGKFNPATGEFLRSEGGQGYADGSSWTRGQAWALYGFTLSALHTGKPEYLETAKRVADNFILQMSEWGDEETPIDFDQPESCRREDSSAAAIAACGLSELGKHDGRYIEKLFT